MKTYLALFTCAENSPNHQAWKKLSPQEQKERFEKGMAEQEQWTKKFKDKFVYEGSPLGEQTKQVDNQGIHDRPSKMGNFMVVKADSLDEAAKMFLEHPHFAKFPGDGVDVIECQDTPRG